MTVLMIGATGEFAGLVLPELKKRGVKVRALVHNQTSAHEASERGADETVIFTTSIGFQVKESPCCTAENCSYLPTGGWLNLTRESGQLRVCKRSSIVIRCKIVRPTSHRSYPSARALAEAVDPTTSY